MNGGFLRCHFMLKNWDLDLIRGGHMDLLLRFGFWLFGVGRVSW